MEAQGAAFVEGDQGERSIGGGGRRAGWNLASQALTSISTLLVSLVVLGVGSADEFGAFAASLLTYFLAAELVRALVCNPLVIAGADLARSETDAALGTAASVGAGVGMGLAVFGLLTGHASALVIAAALPVLMLEDALRHVGIGRGRPQVTAMCDGAWLATQASLVAALLATGVARPPVVVATWVAGAAVGAVVGAWRLQVRPDLRGVRRWLRHDPSVWRPLLAETAAMSSSYYVVIYGVGVVGSVTELGELRAAQTALGPVNVLLLAGLTFGLSESVRRRDDLHALRTVSMRISAALAAVSLAAGVAVWLLLPRVGPTLFDETWAGARRAVPGLTAFCITVGLSTGATVALRALGENRAVRRWRTLSGAVLVSLGLPLAGVAGPGGAFTALATAETIYLALAWTHLARAHAEGARRL